jgi:hypothetical protein
MMSIDKIVNAELEKVEQAATQSHQEESEEEIQTFIKELDFLISKLESSISKLSEHQSQFTIDDTSSQVLSDFGFSSEFTYKQSI